MSACSCEREREVVFFSIKAHSAGREEGFTVRMRGPLASPQAKMLH